MRIDAHAHFLPDTARRAYQQGTQWHGITFTRDAGGVLVSERDGHRFVFGSTQHFETMGQRVGRMNARGVDTELLSLLPPLFGYAQPPAETAALARDVNDELSELSSLFPGRFLGLATLPLQEPAAAVAELNRAMALPGIVGVVIGTHVNGMDLDAAPLTPFWRTAAEHGAFVFIHPVAPRDRGTLGRFYLRNVIGNPLETTIAAVSLMLSGRLAALPGLPVCLAHGGGYVIAAAGRVHHAYRVRSEASGHTDQSPREQLRRFFYDTLTHDERGLRHLVDVLGMDRVVLGTDFPADMGQTDAVNDIERSALFSSQEKEAILGGNLETVLRHRLRPREPAA